MLVIAIIKYRSILLAGSGGGGGGGATQRGGLAIASHANTFYSALRRPARIILFGARDFFRCSPALTALTATEERRHRNTRVDVSDTRTASRCLASRNVYLPLSLDIGSGVIAIADDDDDDHVHILTVVVALTSAEVARCRAGTTSELQ